MERFGEIVAAALGRLWRLLRVLWVCRVAALSALGGGLLIARVAQARDLFADTGLAPWQWAVFYGLLFCWAWLVHAIARRALQFDDWVPEAHRPGGLADDDRARLQDTFIRLALWVPRALGFSIFLFVAWALWQTRDNLLTADALEPAREAIAWIRVQLIATAAAAIAYSAAVYFNRDIQARFTGRDKQKPLLDRAESILLLLLHPAKNWPKLRRIFSLRYNQVLLAIAIVITGLFVAAVIGPNVLSDVFPRVLFLPLLLGGGLLLFGEIAALSHRFATPLLLGFFVLGGIAGYLQNHYNDVRYVAAAPLSAASGPRHELTIDEAISRWKVDNCSAGVCPRPIVIAGAGGASRAGFFTASVVGALIDAGADPALGLGDVRSRIFALSTVSGSSVGAVMMRAAWMDALARGDIAVPPCAGKQPTAWFRSTAARAPERNAQFGSWRDCFQQLMAGDFLSTVFVGLAYRDIFPLGYGEDRTGLLEQAFERWYREITSDGTGGESSAVSACDGETATGLCRRLGHLPDRPDPKARGAWIPLLFINGTSVTTGRRIITADVRIGCRAQAGRLLDYAYDYRELRDPSIRRAFDDCSPAAAKPEPPDPAGQAIDLRLSTAAMMSARFPLISTQGVIRDVSGVIVDSVVDGGYFENDGLATAADIVRELRSRDLKPVVIRIVNDPDEALDASRALTELVAIDGEQVPARPLLPKSRERSLFDVYTSIGRALYATRSGHEDGHLAYLRETLAGPLVRIGVDRIDPAPRQPAAASAFCRAEVSAPTAMETVSMSWWMSQPVQAYLDAQLCRPQTGRLLCVLRLKPDEPAGKCDPAVQANLQ